MKRLMILVLGLQLTQPTVGKIRIKFFDSHGVRHHIREAQILAEMDRNGIGC